jgi:hypothetical protein
MLTCRNFPELVSFGTHVVKPPRQSGSGDRHETEIVNVTGSLPFILPNHCAASSTDRIAHGSWRILVRWVKGAEINPIEGRISARQARNFTVHGRLARPVPTF